MEKSRIILEFCRCLKVSLAWMCVDRVLAGAYMLATAQQEFMEPGCVLGTKLSGTLELPSSSCSF